MALRQQFSRFADFLRANKELISVAGAAGLAMFGLGATYSLLRADKRNLELQLQKEIELRQKDVEKEIELRQKDVEKERELREKDVKKERELRETDVKKERELREKDVEKERELRRKGEEGLKGVIEAVKAEAAEKMMERIMQLGFHENYEKYRRELTRDGQ
ncbi:probable protein split ends [Coccomyxa sp. Obi]|nr:probable protein split ends [Coccomyxa sp. Obi]